MNWNKSYRGSDLSYGESIYTNRLELIGNYQLPVHEKIIFSGSYNYHHQDSWYGKTPYLGIQHIGFGQMAWYKSFKNQEWLGGIALRYNVYDDNSAATHDPLAGVNRPSRTLLPGVFIQDEIRFSDHHTILAGLRYDHHPVHGDIITPRFAWKWKTGKEGVFRLNAGTGFRVVNLFTEEHAALTGARKVVISEELEPEKSYNVNLNYTYRIPFSNGFMVLDGSTWYTLFTNQILPDYDSNPDEIRYQNLNGRAISKGISISSELNIKNRFRSQIGFTLQDIRQIKELEDGKEDVVRPVLTETWSGVWSFSYRFPAHGWNIDYTGNVYGPMRLPLLGSLDPRRPYSPVWSIQNIQVTKKIGRKMEMYGGIKNLLNWTPNKGNPFIIARAEDPFDKRVEYDNNGQILQTAENPYALSFDPAYVYGPNQGRRIFLGFRVTVF
jgi:outer membrane receptor for ferrienterochelin and colicins